MYRGILDFREQQIVDIKVLDTPTGDVMLSFIEKFGRYTKPVHTRGMSDGTLRYLSILVALVGEKPGTTVVVEEVDNGLNPSRAYKPIYTKLRILPLATPLVLP